MMAQAGVQPDADVTLQEIYWMARENQRLEAKRFALLKAMLQGVTDEVRSTILDDED